MERRLFTELRSFYESSREKPKDIRIRIRMRDLIDPDVLRHAVDTAMQRYPYFSVELQKKDGQWFFLDNHRPVVITNSLHGVELNSEASNYHMISFAWQDNWMVMDVCHAMTDGTGAYEILRTLLYYYCSEKYGVTLTDDEIEKLVSSTGAEGYCRYDYLYDTRMSGGAPLRTDQLDLITDEEWVDPVEIATDLPVPPRTEMSKAINPVDAAGLQNDVQPTVYSIAIPEAEFMKFNIDNDGSPGTMVALFLSRAIAKMYPENKDAIRVALCVNQRKALHAPRAHQSLVGGVMLEYKEKLRNWPLDRQATAYRGMVFAQTQEETVLAGVASQKGINQMILSKETDQERMSLASYISNMASGIMTATVSYVGKANYKEAEKYIRDFRLWTPQTGNCILIEISAVNGRFTLDFMQPFSSPVYVNAFLKELDENGITYDLQDVNPLELPNIKLPWSE